MSNFFLVPVVPYTDSFGQIYNAPKYSSADVTPLYTDFTCTPFGGDGYAVLHLDAANPTLAGQPDVYSLPENLSAVLVDSDVTTLTTFLDSTGVIPSSWLVSGQTWLDALRSLLQIALVFQSLYGATGQTVFPAGSGVTLDTTVGSQSLGKGIHGSGGTTLSAVQIAAGSTAGVFDLTSVDASQTLGDTLYLISTQFTDAIFVGGSTI